MTRAITVLWALLLASILLSCKDGNSNLPQKKDLIDPPLDESKASDDWSIFRGSNNLSGRIKSNHMPDSDKLALSWKFKTEEEIKGSPVVADGVLYIGSSDGYLYALNAETGKLIWKFKTGATIEASPTVLNGTVYIGSADDKLYAVDVKMGKEIWQFKTHEKIIGAVNWFKKEETHYIVFGSYDNFIYCLDAKEGKLSWKFESENFINGSPAISKDAIIIGGCDAQLYIVGLDGKAKNKVDLDTYIAASAAIYDNVAYVGNQGDSAFAVDLEKAEILWTYKGNEAGYLSSPAISMNKVLIGCQDGSLHCINRKTGKKEWLFKTKDSVDSSPVICGWNVIFGSNDGRLYIVDLKNGKKKWSYEIGEAVSSSPAVYKKMIYIGSSDGTLYAFGEKEK
jgi:outer membrane protein assembly factor BamB